MTYRVARGLFLLLARPLFGFRVAGAERLPSSGPAIVVAPHRSWLDPACVAGACRRPVRFLVLRGVYGKPWARWFYRRMGAVPIDTGGAASLAALREALRLLARGECVGVFPEGRVVDPREPVRAQSGAALLAVRSGAPLVPLRIEGSDRAWPRGRRWPRRATVRVSVGTPFAPPPRTEPGAVAEATRRIEAALDDAPRETPSEARG